MKRYVLIFLLMLLPLQCSWAAVASYCQHENVTGAQHIGHHTSDAEKKKAPVADKKLSDSGDADCSACHFSCSKSMSSHAMWISATVGKNTFIPSLTAHYLSHIGDTPEKPDWLTAA